MNNPFQEQLLKAGLVTKQQVQKVQQEKNKHQKQNRPSKKNKPIDPAILKAQQAAEAKANRDRELNQKKQEQARKKAVSVEINQLISQNSIKRDEKCEVAYNFEHKKKVHRIYVNADLKQRIIDGKLGIARIEGRYELVPLLIAEKIQQRNDQRIVIFQEEVKPASDQDSYADYEIPDDLMW